MAESAASVLAASQAPEGTLAVPVGANAAVERAQRDSDEGVRVIILHDIDGYATEIPLHTMKHAELEALRLPTGSTRGSHGAQPASHGEVHALHVQLPVSASVAHDFALFCTTGRLPGDDTTALARLYAVSAHLRFRRLRDAIEASILRRLEESGVDVAPPTYGTSTFGAAASAAQSSTDGAYDESSPAHMTNAELLTGVYRERYAVQALGEPSATGALPIHTGWSSLGAQASAERDADADARMRASAALPDPFHMLERARGVSAEFLRESRSAWRSVNDDTASGRPRAAPDATRAASGVTGGEVSADGWASEESNTLNEEDLTRLRRIRDVARALRVL